MSMGYLVGEDAPVVWRGLMVMKALQQLLLEVEWGGLDVLVLDLPPGTGDTQLSVTQQVVLDGMDPEDELLRGLEAGTDMTNRLDNRHNASHTSRKRCRERHKHVQKGQCTYLGFGAEHVYFSMPMLQE